MQLTKTVLCLPVACSAGFGYILQRPVVDRSFLLVMLGVLALACGAATGNSLQEIRIDRLYTRTCHRPLVTGRLRVVEATLICGLLVISGCGLLLASATSQVPLFLGLMALVAYNGLYTPMKQVSPFALLPGGFAGALPPLIGWTAAGGAPITIASWLLFALFFLWQIPHFLLVLFRHQQDYRHAGPPYLLGQLSEAGTKRVLLVWLVSLVTVILAFPLLLPQLLLASKVFLLMMAGWVLGLGLLVQFGKKGGGSGGMFFSFNACFFLTLLMVMAVQLWW